MEPMEFHGAQGEYPQRLDTSYPESYPDLLVGLHRRSPIRKQCPLQPSERTRGASSWRETLALPFTILMLTYPEAASLVYGPPEPLPKRSRSIPAGNPPDPWARVHV